MLLPSSTRRRMLKAGIASASLFLPAPYAWVWAQSEGTLKLLKLPKIALVLGNSRYKDAPLANPANDAKAIADTLRTTGFNVTLKMDAAHADMAAAVQTYTAALATTKGVGLFYYAGHGIQLAWRNYMLPVDADIGTIADIQKQGVEVNALLEGITKASNAMNIIILDACRDNPFGSLKGIEQKGLSQMDAPNGTLLAYATSPGNVASDGEGSNGLYTENLLREIKVPEAKVEDVFKRVRLGVRLKSKGAQVPWESTSLEEDFWFVPPRSLAVIAEEEIQRQRKEQQALLEKRLSEETAELKRKLEQAAKESKLAAEQAEQQRQQELAAIEQKRITDEARRKREQELALAEAKKVQEQAEWARREEQARLEAKRADEEAARKLKEELAALEQRRKQTEEERLRREQQTLEEARAAEEAAARKLKEEAALRERQLAREEEERRRRQAAAPVVISKPSTEELNRRYAEESSIWEKIKASQVTGPLEDYLRRFPSGYFSELAQARLDQLLAREGEKKITIVSDARNPYSKGVGVTDTNYKIGDSYVYQVSDLLTKVVGTRITETVTQITDTEIVYSNGVIRDRLGNGIRARDGIQYSANQTYPAEYLVGKKWSFRGSFRDQGRVGDLSKECRVTGRERITVPAGTFDAFRIEGNGLFNISGFSGSTQSVYWADPNQVRLVIANEDLRRIGGRIIRSERYELMSYQQS